ncbi:hypothetical protein A9Q96_10080 [Rhodobacterales bacterium 52_120_T64]|nr:hypothetical protein A9Q96_10080 [Rhodobacterales bacterium 52_120_T64]
MRTEKVNQQTRIRPGTHARNLAEEYMEKSNLSFTEALEEGIIMLKSRTGANSTNNSNPELSEKLDQILKAVQTPSNPLPREATSDASTRALSADMQFRFNQFGDLLHADNRVTFAGISKIAMEVSLLRHALNSMAADGTPHQKELMHRADEAIKTLNKNVKDFRIREGFEFPDMSREWHQSVMALQESRGGEEHDLDHEQNDQGDREHER